MSKVFDIYINLNYNLFFRWHFNSELFKLSNLVKKLPCLEYSDNPQCIDLF